MTAENIWGSAIMGVLAVGVALVVFFLIRKSLRALLDEVVGLPSCKTFYTRILLLGMLFLALSVALQTDFAFKEDAAFMRYVWEVADGLSSTFLEICLFMTGYLVIVTILVAALRRRHE